MRQILVRPTSSGGARLHKQAQRLGRKTPAGRSKSQILDGFLLRAQGGEDRVIVHVIELPLYIVGAYGGLDAPTASYGLFVQSTVIGRAGMQAHLLATSIKQDPESATGYRPWMTDNYSTHVAVGGGFVQIGELPAWGSYRDANIDAVGPASICPSALLITTCAKLDAASNAERSLLLTRSNGKLKREVYYNEDGSVRPPSEYAQLGGQPVSTPQAVESAEKTAVIEFSPALFPLADDEHLHKAGPALEWGAARGLASVSTTLESGGGMERMAFAAYRLSDAQNEDGSPSVAGAIEWIASLSHAQLPSEDRSTPQAASPSVAVAGYSYSGWAASETDVYGRDDAPSNMAASTSEGDHCGHMSMWAAGVGYTLDADMPIEAVGVLSLKTAQPGQAVTARGWQWNGSTYLYADSPTTENRYWRHLTYAFRVTQAGVVLTRLAAFDEARYSHHDQLALNRYATYDGVTTDSGEARIPVTKHIVRYEIVAASTDDGPTPAQPAYKRRQPTALWVRVADLSWALVSGNGTETPINLGAYYVSEYNNKTEAPGDGAPSLSPPSDGRAGYGGFDPDAGYTGYSYLRSEPFCQYAPGILAVLVSPKSDYVAATHTLRIALVNVQTGTVTHLSPALLGYATATKLTLTCFEQGAVDEIGNLIAHGRLLLSASTSDDSETRMDGFFVINNLRDLAWLAREPSNTRAVYAGSPMYPAELGVTTGLKYLKPTAIDPP